jgi:hypothetical protein
MAMIETAYSVRDYARVMVGSEELEPGPGWNYESWLKPLVDHPAMTGSDLAKVIVKSYETNYAPGTELEDRETTLSAVDLSKFSSLAEAVSQLSSTLIQHLSAEKGHVNDARDRCQEYAPGLKLYHVDLGRLLRRRAILR